MLRRSWPRGGAEGSPVGPWVGAAPEAVGIDPNELGVAHEVAPVLDDLDVVAARPQRLAHVVAEARLEPERPGLVAPGAPVEPARRLDRGLRPEPAVEALRDQRGLGLRLALAAHRAVDEVRAAVP